MVFDIQKPFRLSPITNEQLEEITFDDILHLYCCLDVVPIGFEEAISLTYLDGILKIVHIACEDECYSLAHDAFIWLFRK